MRGKIFTFFLIYFSTFNQLTFSQPHIRDFSTADSLFSARNYHQSFQIYSEIFRSGYYSPQMLMKMTHIAERSGDFVSALYFLNSYYYHQPQRSVYEKMEDIAEKHKLRGYDYTDFEHFQFLYKEYYYYIIFVLLSVAGLYFIHLTIKKIKGNPLGIRPFMFFCFLMFMFYLINFDVTTPSGIVKTQNTLVMSAPAAGSNLLAAIKPGERVIVLSKEDIWYKVEWNDREAYIKESDLMIIGKL